MWVFSRALIGAAVLAVALYFIPQTNHLFSKNTDRLLDLFDGRPVETVFFLGNSRTYSNDLPYLVRKMADSAGAPVRYEMSIAAWGGASLDALAANADVQQALTRHWDHVFLQGESRAHLDDTSRHQFQVGGAKLLAAANAQHSPAALIVNWAYSTDFFAGLGGTSYDPSQLRGLYLTSVQLDHRRLSESTGAKLVNTCLAWEAALRRDPQLQLYKDGNHPSLAGSYLAALTVYAFLSHQDVGKVTYVPRGLDDATAQTLIEIVRSQQSL
ncbi:hypothetical protein [Dongia sp.]|uniref:hypothetical protein n=1 Tax=Dongia sp. TaxID=1977262 RepID=UPI0035AF1F54